MTDEDEGDYTCADAPKCPRCGHIERDAWEIDFGGCEGDTTVSCNSCGADYFCSRTCSFSYSSKALP